MADVKSTVLDFVKVAFQEKKPADVRSQMRDDYIQHNPVAPDGADAFVEVISGMQSQLPDFSYTIRRTAVDGDLVWIHAEVHMAKGDRGMSVVDIFRVQDGLIAEHWDIIQEVPETAQNDNGMF